MPVKHVVFRNYDNVTGKFVSFPRVEETGIKDERLY
jgi:hypothetical protein